MKWIQKKNEPAKLAKWRKDNKVKDDKVTLKITEQTLDNLKKDAVPDDIVKEIESIKNKEFKEEHTFLDALKKFLEKNQIAKYKLLVLKYVNKEHKKYFKYDLTSEVKKELKDILLKEQGWICAYTGHEIDSDSSHIEHLKPQKYCKNGEDVDYYNLVVCYPGIDENTGTTRPCLYGAIAKDRWPAPEEQDQFVSPLDKSCETRFYYLYSGKVKAKSDADAAAKTTIDKLMLNDDDLCNHRYLVIRGTLDSLKKNPANEKNKKALIIAKAKKALQTLKSEEGGKLKSFYFVRIQAIENFIQTLQK